MKVIYALTSSTTCFKDIINSGSGTVVSLWNISKILQLTLTFFHLACYFPLTILSAFLCTDLINVHSTCWRKLYFALCAVQQINETSWVVLHNLCRRSDKTSVMQWNTFSAFILSYTTWYLSTCTYDNTRCDCSNNGEDKRIPFEDHTDDDLQ